MFIEVQPFIYSCQVRTATATNNNGILTVGVSRLVPAKN